MRLHVKAFALTCAIIWGLGLFLITWWLILLEGTPADRFLLCRVYYGFSITPLGSFIGLICAFVDGLIGGAVFAWLYNLLAGRPAVPQS